MPPQAPLGHVAATETTNLLSGHSHSSPQVFNTVSARYARSPVKRRLFQSLPFWRGALSNERLFEDYLAVPDIFPRWLDKMLTLNVEQHSTTSLIKSLGHAMSASFLVLPATPAEISKRPNTILCKGSWGLGGRPISGHDRKRNFCRQRFGCDLLLARQLSASSLLTAVGTRRFVFKSQESLREVLPTGKPAPSSNLAASICRPLIGRGKPSTLTKVSATCSFLRLTPWHSVMACGPASSVDASQTACNARAWDQQAARDKKEPANCCVLRPFAEMQPWA